MAQVRFLVCLFNVQTQKLQGGILSCCCHLPGFCELALESKIISTIPRLNCVCPNHASSHWKKFRQFHLHFAYERLFISNWCIDLNSQQLDHKNAAYSSHYLPVLMSNASTSIGPIWSKFKAVSSFWTMSAKLSITFAQIVKCDDDESNCQGYISACFILLCCYFTLNSTSTTLHAFKYL